MELLFLDESGTPAAPDKVDKNPYFVLGGLVVPELQWKALQFALNSIKREYDINGEIKWRYFFPHPKSTKVTPLSHLAIDELNGLRARLFELIAEHNSLRVLATIVDTKAYYEQNPDSNAEDMYHDAFREVCCRFQYYLQDRSRANNRLPFYGMVVIDERNNQENKRLENFHYNLLTSDEHDQTQYNNLIEGLFIAASHHSVGVQFADLVAGAVYRKVTKNDSSFYDIIQGNVRSGPYGVNGFGIMSLPKGIVKF